MHIDTNKMATHTEALQGYVNLPHLSQYILFFLMYIHQSHIHINDTMYIYRHTTHLLLHIKIHCLMGTVLSCIYKETLAAFCDAARDAAICAAWRK